MIQASATGLNSRHSGLSSAAARTKMRGGNDHRDPGLGEREASPRQLTIERAGVARVERAVRDPVEPHRRPARRREGKHHENDVPRSHLLHARGGQHAEQGERQREERVGQLDEVDVADEEGFAGERLAFAGGKR